MQDKENNLTTSNLSSYIGYVLAGPLSVFVALMLSGIVASVGESVSGNQLNDYTKWIMSGSYGLVMIVAVPVIYFTTRKLGGEQALKHVVIFLFSFLVAYKLIFFLFGYNWS